MQCYYKAITASQHKKNNIKKTTKIRHFYCIIQIFISFLQPKQKNNEQFENKL